MKPIIFFALLFFCTVAQAAILAPKGATVAVYPTKITDGDTIHATYNGADYKLRLACIDAPETWHVPYGANSKAALATLALPGPINALVRQTNDGYGRSVVELFRDTTNLNLALVSQGQAFVEPRYVSQCGADAYYQAEAAAKALGQGVWSVPGGIIRPWDCRKTPAQCKTPPASG